MSSKVYLVKPPKPISDMSKQEMDKWLEEVWEAMQKDRKGAK